MSQAQYSYLENGVSSERRYSVANDGDALKKLRYNVGSACSMEATEPGNIGLRP